MRKATWTVGFAMASALTAMASAASAQTPTTAKSGYVETRATGTASVIFDDDPMTAPGMDAVGVTLKVRGGPARFLLIRPRVSFLQELQKSVEAL